MLSLISMAYSDLVFEPPSNGAGQGKSGEIPGLCRSGNVGKIQRVRMPALKANE